MVDELGDNDDHGLHMEWRYKWEKERNLMFQERKLAKKLLMAQTIMISVFIGLVLGTIIFMAGG